MPLCLKLLIARSISSILFHRPNGLLFDSECQIKLRRVDVTKFWSLAIVDDQFDQFAVDFFDLSDLMPLVVTKFNHRFWIS